MANKKKRLFIGWSERPFPVSFSTMLSPNHASDRTAEELFHAVWVNEGLLWQTDGDKHNFLNTFPHSKRCWNKRWASRHSGHFGFKHTTNKWHQNKWFMFIVVNNPCEEKSIECWWLVDPSEPMLYSWDAHDPGMQKSRNSPKNGFMMISDW